MLGLLAFAIGLGQSGLDSTELTELFDKLEAKAPYEQVLEEVQQALIRGANPNARRAEALLFFSARDDRGKIVEALLKAGANPNMGISSAWIDLDRTRPAKAGLRYPLHAAVCARNPNNVKLLLRYGAKTEVYGAGFRGDTCSSTATPLAVCAELPYRTFPRARRLDDAEAEKRDIEIAGLLLGAGANIHWSRSNWKLTPLHLAAMTGKPQLAAFLVKRGASKKRLTTGGQNPYDVAQRRHPNNKELLRVLDFPGRKPGPPPPKPPPDYP